MESLGGAETPFTILLQGIKDKGIKVYLQRILKTTKRHYIHLGYRKGISAISMEPIRALT